jgi:sugar phosphate permease
MLWIVAAVLLILWLAGVVFRGDRGFIHILLLCAIVIIVVQWVASRRASS